MNIRYPIYEGVYRILTMILWLFSAGFPKGGYQRGGRKFLIRKNSFLQRVVLIESPQLRKIVHFSRFFAILVV